VNEEAKTNPANVGAIQKLTRLLAAPVIEPSQRAARIQAVERDIVLPLRLLIIAFLGYYFFFSHWLDTPGPNSAADFIRFHSRAAARQETPGPKAAPDAGAKKPERRAALEAPGANGALDLIKDWSLHNAGMLKGSFTPSSTWPWGRFLYGRGT
jgi:hypothetical protein